MKIITLLSRHYIRESIWSILYLTFFQHNLPSIWDPGAKSFPEGVTSLTFRMSQLFWRMSRQDKKRQTHLSINSLVTEAIMHGASSPDHPHQLSHTLLLPWRFFQTQRLFWSTSLPFLPSAALEILFWWIQNELARERAHINLRGVETVWMTGPFFFSENLTQNTEIIPK